MSEFMLQQTQVERVIPLYRAFVERFPAFDALAAAPAGDAVRAWRGLGYNSRALRLHALARAVVDEHGGRLPEQSEALRALPGIGPYTAAAVRAFAFEADDVALDVNLRRVVHRIALGLEHPPRARDRELDTIAREAVPPGRAHAWNSALMDLGATICGARAPKCLICPLRADCAAAPVDRATLSTLARAHASSRKPQARLPFEGTVRFVRGRIVDRLRDLPAGQPLSLESLQRELAPIVPHDRLSEIPAIVAALEREMVVEVEDAGVRLR